MKTILTFFIAIALLAAFSGVSPAQEKCDSVTLKHNLGFGAGFTTGVGLSYRFMPDDFGFQLTFGPVADEYSTKISAGATLLFKVIGSKYANLFIYQGNHVFYDKHEAYDYLTDQYSTVDRTQYNTGLGFGVEFVIFKRGSLNFMTGYAAYDSFDRVSMTGELGFYFKF